MKLPQENNCPAPLHEYKEGPKGPKHYFHRYIFILSLSSVQDISFFETVVFCHVCPEHQTTRLADDKPAETG